MEIARVQGRELHYSRRGNGDPLLLIHGFPLDHSIWGLLADQLEGDFDLIMPDLPGFGQSESFPADDFSISSLATTLVEFLEMLDIPAAYIVGHSMGGYVALAFAQAYPEHVLGLGLVASQAIADTPERKAGRYATAEKIAQFGSHALSDMADKLTNRPVLGQGIREIILRQSQNTLIGALKAMAARDDATPYTQLFNFPVVLIHGQADVLIPAERARDVKIQIPAARLLEIPDVGHSPMLEAPVETARALRLFHTAAET
jgi:3-oxoadipate enol-lactonase